MTAIRRWPSSSRWRAASSPPFQLFDPTVGTDAVVALSVSTTTKGMCSRRSWLSWDWVGLHMTSSTPTGRRLSTPSSQSSGGR